MIVTPVWCHSAFLPLQSNSFGFILWHHFRSSLAWASEHECAKTDTTGSLGALVLKFDQDIRGTLHMWRYYEQDILLAWGRDKHMQDFSVEISWSAVCWKTKKRMALRFCVKKYVVDCQRTRVTMCTWFWIKQPPVLFLAFSISVDLDLRVGYCSRRRCSKCLESSHIVVRAVKQ